MSHDNETHYIDKWSLFLFDHAMKESDGISNQLAQLRDTLLVKKWRLATAESCTGGQLSARITDLPGSSQWFECAFVTYSNEAKAQMLGVLAQTLSEHGAVSEHVVKAMAKGALHHSSADISVAISGVAGPDGGSKDKPVGMVCFAFATVDGLCFAETHYFSGSRQSIREQAVLTAIIGLLACL